MFQEVTNYLYDKVILRENETGREFINRSLKTAVKVGGYALAILAGVAILFSLKFTIPFFIVHPTATTGALELASISYTNYTIIWGLCPQIIRKDRVSLT